LPVMPATGPIQFVFLDDVVDATAFFLRPDAPSRKVVELVSPRTWRFSESSAIIPPVDALAARPRNFDSGMARDSRLQDRGCGRLARLAAAGAQRGEARDCPRRSRRPRPMVRIPIDVAHDSGMMSPAIPR